MSGLGGTELPGVCRWAELRFLAPWPGRREPSVGVKVKYGLSRINNILFLKRRSEIKVSMEKCKHLLNLDDG